MSQVITKSDLQAINAAIGDELGALVADGVNAWIENLTSRSWGEEKTATEGHTASGAIWLRHMDVIEVQSVTTGRTHQAQTTVAPTSYYVDPDGRLDLGGTGSGRGSYVTVTYSYGVPDDAIPADLKMAAIALGAAWAQWITNGGREVTGAQVDTYRLQFAASSAGDPTQSTASRDLKVISSYALRRV